ncbi:uncharacterized protein [Drosophila takahashii]|uniref:uncharacterized protein n=1 Tax=Drosophila takahashii TaxID=29030 RepID=UPI001CF838B2|nr:uncharacterized protein LOC108066375 [Drosophila takahashii]
MISLIVYSFLFFTGAAESNVKVIKYGNSVDTIVKDLIDNWQSPLVYLKSRGYLPKDLQIAPELDFQQMQGNLSPDLPLLNKDSKREIEEEKSVKARSLQDPKDLDLKRMFQTLFSSNDKGASEEIQSKLGVSWDMNALKSSARLGAKKYLEKFNSKRNQGISVSLWPNEAPDAPPSSFSAQIIPQISEKSNEPGGYSKPNFLNGVAKILGNPEIRYKDWDSKPASQEVLPKATGKEN